MGLTKKDIPWEVPRHLHTVWQSIDGNLLEPVFSSISDIDFSKLELKYKFLETDESDDN